jgi:hypothetical protein
MAGRVRFGARTGGAPVILGTLLAVAALSIGNVGVAFLFGLATQWLLRQKLLER